MAIGRGASGASGSRGTRGGSPPPLAPAPGPAGREVRLGADLALRFLLVVAAIYVAVRILNAVSLVTITVVVSLLITALLQPGVAWLVRRGLPRPAAALAVFVLGVIAITALGWFVVAQVTSNAASLGARLQDSLTTVQHWLAQGPLHLSQTQVDQLGKDLQDAVSANRFTIISGVFATASSAIGVLSGGVLCLFATLFLLLDDGTIWRWVVGLFPRPSRPRVVAAGAVGWRTLSAYMRSVVVLALINAATMVPVLLIGGVPLAVPLGVLLFLGSLIPLVGMLVAGLLVVLVALVTQGAVVALVVAVALVLTVQLEGNLLNPLIMGKAVQIHALAILLVVTGGTILGGVFGAFIAVPLVAVLNTVMSTVRGLEPDDANDPDRAGGTGDPPGRPPGRPPLRS